MLTRSRSSSTDTSEGGSQSQASSLGDSAPLEEYVSRTKKRKGPVPSRVTQWVCLLPDDVEKKCEDSFVSLKDPSSGVLRRYLLRKNNSLNENQFKLYEVMKFSDGQRSWFIDNTLQSDGSLYISTPIDPLFLALPYLTAAAKCGKFTSLDTILENDSQVLEHCIPSEQWDHITDNKAVASELRVYKYNWEKTHLWLKSKVEALSVGLKEQGVYVGAGSMSSSLVNSKQTSLTKVDYLRYACGMVCNYLCKELADKLLEDYPRVSHIKREANGEGSEPPPAKRGKPEHNGEPIDDYSKLNTTTSVKKTIPLSASQKAIAKIDKTGMKSLASFFKKK